MLAAIARFVLSWHLRSQSTEDLREERCLLVPQKAEWLARRNRSHTYTSYAMVWLANVLIDGVNDELGRRRERMGKARRAMRRLMAWVWLWRAKRAVDARGVT